MGVVVHTLVLQKVSNMSVAIQAVGDLAVEINVMHKLTTDDYRRFRQKNR